MKSVQNNIEVVREDDGYRVRPHGIEQLSTSTLVIFGIAFIKDVEPDGLSPRLSSVINPDALDVIFWNSEDEQRTSLSFEVWDCHVTVFGEESIHIVPDGPSPA